MTRTRASAKAAGTRHESAIAAALSDIADDNGETTCDWTAEARAALAKIRETHTIEPKPATGPLGGAR